MKYVEFYKLKNNGNQIILGKCYLTQNNNVYCDGPDIFSNNLEKNGIKNYDQPNQTLYFKDGLKFLEQLKYNFTSGYLNASDVKEE